MRNETGKYLSILNKTDYLNNKNEVLQSFSSVQLLSHVQLFVTPWTAAHVLVHGDSPGKNTGVGCHALLQGIFPSQGSNPGLLDSSQILYQLSYQGSTKMGLSGLESRCQQGCLPSGGWRGAFVFLPFSASRGHRISWLVGVSIFKANNDRSSLFSCCIAVTLTLLPPFSTFYSPCDYIGPIWKIQACLPTLKSAD